MACSFARMGSSATPGFTSASVGTSSSRNAVTCRIHHRLGTKMSVTVPGSVPVKAFRGHADDLVTVVAHAERAADHLRVASEAPRPIVVREHRVGMRAGRAVVVLR